MRKHSLYRRIVAGQAGGWAAAIRAILGLLEHAYARAVAVRNRRYDREGASTVLPVPVISVGNITVGGTGKTPFVIDLVRRLEALGRKPAVIARGYKPIEGRLNDEQRLIQQSCPGVLCFSDPNRSRAGEAAWRKHGADVIVLDDGFQHRRLGRKLDIVLIDATCPFGYGHVLPRGLLREPVAGLWRAQVIVITRADQVLPDELSRIEGRIREIATESTVLQCRHRVTDIRRLDGTVVAEPLEGKRVVLLAGIGNPPAFRATVEALGVEVVGEQWWPDHHHYHRHDVENVLAPGRFPPHDLLLTTEKDAVKLARIAGLAQDRIRVVCITIDLLGGGDRMLQSILVTALAKS